MNGVNNFSYVDFHKNFHGMLSLQFSEVRQNFLKAGFYWGSFDIGLIRVGAHRKVRLIVVSRLIQVFRT